MASQVAIWAFVSVHALHTPAEYKKNPLEHFVATVADLQAEVEAAQATQVFPKVTNPYFSHPALQAAVVLAAQATQVAPTVVNPALLQGS